MIYANDQWVQLPVKDLYDNQIMLAAIGAARDMYEKGQQEIKDFKKEYGDFFSPIQSDMDWYNKNVTGKVRDAINTLYANGIDPLRSAEGRAAISRIIGDVDITTANQMKQAAETKKQYNAAAAKMGPKYNKEFADWYFAKTHNGIRPDEWDTSKYGAFPDATPPEFQSLQDLTISGYKGRTPRMLTQSDFDTDPRLKGYVFDPNYMYTGYLDSDLMKVSPGISLSLAGNPNAEFFREKSAEKVIAAGKEPTPENIEAQFQRDIADANTQALIDPTREADPFALDNVRTANDIRAHSANAATDYHYYKLRGGGGNGDSDDEQKPNIFRRAEELADVVNTGISGEPATYITSSQRRENIVPVVQAGTTLGKNSTTGETIPVYNIKGADLSKYAGAIAYLGKDNKMHSAKLTNPRPNAVYSFEGDGNMRAERIRTDKNGKPVYKYWISGKLTRRQGDKPAVGTYTGNDPNIKDTGNTLWLQVKEDYVYGQTQKKK